MLAVKKFLVFLMGLWACSMALENCAIARQKGEFAQYEIRVIRPRYFQKSKRFELGAQAHAIMNQTFIYSYLGSAMLGYHLSEQIAVEANGSFGFSLDRDEKRALSDEFKIYTKIMRTQYSIEGMVTYTPMYGKWQVSSGKLIYFDTYVSAGGGLTGVDLQYSDFCADQFDSAGNKVPVPADRTASYPTIAFGIGQRYFVEQDFAVKWDLRNHSMFYNTVDTACSANATEGDSATHHNITLQFGASKFF